MIGSQNFRYFFENIASLKSFSLKPMEKVFIGLEDWSCINAAIVEESIPPDKKAPMETSPIIWPFTESLNNLSKHSTISV